MKPAPYPGWPGFAIPAPKLLAAAGIVIALVLSVFPSAASADTELVDELVGLKGDPVAEVLLKPTLYREAALPGLPCTVEQFEFFIDHPRISMVLARQYDASMDKYDIEMMPDGSYHVDDDGRLVGDMELVAGERGRRVYYISGYWKFLLGMKFNGRMVLEPVYEERPGEDRPVVDAVTRGYMKVDNALAGFVARVVAFVFPGKVDRRIGRFAGAVRKVAEAVREDPAGVYETLRAKGEVPPGELELFRETFLAGAPGVKK